MRASAKVDEVTAAVATRHCAVGHLVGDQLNLEWVAAEQLKSLILREHATLEWLIFLADIGRMLFDRAEVVLFEFPIAEEAVVVESVVEGRPDGQMATELPLHGLAEDVRARMPEHVLALRGVELQELEPAAPLQRPRCVPEHAAHVRGLVVRVVGVCRHDLLQGGDGLRIDHLGDDDRLRQLGRNPLRDVHRSGLESLTVFHLAIWELDLDGFFRFLLNALLVRRDELLPHFEPLLDVRRLLLHLELALELAGLANPGPRARVRPLAGHGAGSVRTVDAAALQSPARRAGH
mmetsp:Transcript_86686/g.169605  ORF Transcript_86686/g.169605 Transcript_86686/m.169605 type:complete len:292 (-) Transcript_86686:11-886(-)